MTRFGSSRLLVLLLGAALLGASVYVAVRPSAPAAPPDVSWDAPLEVARGPAVRGPWRMNDSDWRFVDDPTVAMDAAGTATVVWTDHRRQDLFLQRYGPDGRPQLDAPVDVSRSPDTFSWLPRVAIAPGRPDTLYVLWQEIIFSGGTHGGDVLFARSTDGGRSFEAPINLSRSRAGDGKGRLTAERWHNGSLDLAVGPKNTLYAAWTEYEGRLWLRRSADGGASFAPARRVAGRDTTPARGPSVAVGPSGRVHLAWTVGETPTADLRYAQFDAAGRPLEPPRRVAPRPGHSDAPSLAVDSAGTVHLAYGHRPEGPFRRSHVRYVQAPPDSAFTTPLVLSGRPPAHAASAGFPDLDLGPAGAVVVLWELFPAVQGRPRALGYTRSADGGTTFDRPAAVPGSDADGQGFNGSQQGLLMDKLAVNAAGTVAVVNSTFRPGEHSRVRLYRGRLGGP